MSKRLKKILMILILIICIELFFTYHKNDTSELKSIKSDKQLSRIYDGEEWAGKEILINILTMPFSVFMNGFSGYRYSPVYNTADYAIKSTNSFDSVALESSSVDTVGASKSSSTKDFSTTNIQVENVDEADITKTDGDYIYSLSENEVIITNVMNPEDIKIEAKISPRGDGIPQDLILYKNELVVISSDNNKSRYYSYSENTIVEIYDITNKANPVLVKNYTLNEPYYTSRCIGNKLYVIASGNLREEDDKILRSYKEDGMEREIALDNIKYLKDVETRKQTIISSVDLNNARADVKVNSYLMDISNAYVSENSIYLLDQKYDYDNDGPTVKDLFTLKGVIGLFTYYDDYDYSYERKTQIYKFDILSNGQVVYNTKTEVNGETINQYSLDEKNGHLRVAVYDDNGTRIVIFDDKLREIGRTLDVAKGEKMYASRFIGNKAYLVTYRNMDPLFVIDLSNEASPKVLGELKIPGYSTYLHPYDENHLIGIGMETKEIVNRDSYGKVTSTTARIVGMKMALFDVSDVNHPIELSNTVIGDSRTTSAILTNPKALLFSKERELIAIPVNNYSEDFEVEADDDYSSMINSYTNYNKSYISEGYMVYNININDGFNLKGIITHEADKKKNDDYYYYYYRNNSKLLRGMYIDENLYTVSENAVKVNRLDTLELVDELEIK